MKRYAVFFAFALLLLLPTTVAAAECQFILGFKTLRDLIGHDVVGECLEDEHHNEIGDSVQQTTGGLLVWRKADNWTAFTDGYHSWINGPYGLEQRFNVEFLPWEAEGAIERLPWVQDGLTDLEMRSVSLLETLGKYYSQVLRAVLETERDWLPPQYQADLTPLETIVRMSTVDEVLVRQIVEMPFLEEFEGLDTDALWALRDLLFSSPGSLTAIVSNPDLKDSRTETDGAIILLLVLKARDPEAAAAIETLSWVQDGLASRELSKANPRGETQWEQSVVRDLVALAGHSRPTFLALVEKPWIRDQLETYEAYLVLYFWDFTRWNTALAQRMLEMPFLQSREAYELTNLQTVGELRRFDEQLPGRVLAHPSLAGGITDDHTGALFLIVIELVASQEAAAIRAYPWVQDGIAESELGGLQQLQLVALSSRQMANTLTQKTWVQDGISVDEQKVIMTLGSIAGKNSARRDEALAQQILEMPFLASFENNDLLAIRTLSSLHWTGRASVLQEVLSHPRLSGGIRDDQTVLVSRLGSSLHYALNLLDTNP